MGIKVDIRNGSFDQLQQLAQEGGRIRSKKEGGGFVVYATPKRSPNRVNRLLDYCSGVTHTKRQHVLASVKALCAHHGIDFEQEIRNCGMSAADLDKVLAGKGDLKGEHLSRALARFVEVGDKVFAIDLSKPLGRGANAEVFKAHHGNERIAVRKMLSSNGGLSREVATHALAARKSVGAERSLVLPTHDEVVVAGDGTRYQAMSLAAGSGDGSIRGNRKADTVAVLFSRKDGPLTPPQIQRVKENRRPLQQGFLDRQASSPAVRVTAGDWTTAVAAVGRRGLAHRDIKPENFLLGADGHYQISDFGTAGAENSLFQSTAGGKNFELTGNANDYAKSPEWLRNEAGDSTARFAVGTKDDSFSLGVATWQLLSGGRFPFDGTDAQPDKALNGYAYMQNVLAYADSGQSFSDWYESRHPGLRIPQEWRAYLDASLHADPDQRASAEQLRDLVPRLDQHAEVDEAAVRQTILEKARRGRT